MKKSVHHILIAIAFFCFRPTLSAQNSLTDTTVVEHKLIFPPLADLIDSAIMHNAMIRHHKLEVEAKMSNLKSESIYWTRNLGVQADTRYGTFDNFASNNSGQSTTFFTSTSRQFNYGFGLYMKLPLGDVLNRKQQIKQAKIQIEQATSLEETQEQEIRQQVIRQYQDALLKQRLVNIKSQSLGNARVNMEMVEKEFRNGLIPITEYVRISDIVSHAEADYESAKSDFITSKLLLEEIVGFIFTNTSTTK
jgi:outer membrane protein TolC